MSLESYFSPFTSISPYFQQTTRSVPDLTGQVFKTEPYSFAYGGHGDIWRAKWMDESSNLLNVAVKVVKGVEDPVIRKKFVREMCIWSTLDHPNITPLLGIVFNFDRPQTPCLVSRYYQHGDIRKYIENQPNGNKLALLISQIASGLEYLHARSIIHGDIKPTNILVNDEGEASITDFGLSRVLDTPGFTTAASGTLRYMPPELAKIYEEESMTQVTEATDVWEFSMTALEMLTGTIPFSHIKRDASVTHFVVSGGRPKRVRCHRINNEIWKMLEKCWSPDPIQRPSMTSLFTFFASQAVERAWL